MLNVASVFSGIGAFEFALKRLGVKHDIVFACDNGEIDIDYPEIDLNTIKKLKSIDEKHDFVEALYASKTRRTNFVKKSYLENYKINPKRFFEDIKLLDGTDFKNKVDILVGGSPCQSFSSVGSQAGLEDARGTLFYEYARLIKEIQPKVFIYENVRNLYNHDHKKTWRVIKSVFDSLGYEIHYDILNAADYGVPQIRRRLFVVGFKNSVNFALPTPINLRFTMRQFLETTCSYGNFKKTKSGRISIKEVPGEIDDKYTLSPLLYNYVMRGGTGNFYQRPEINLNIARTILKTMGNRHRAGVDNYVSDDFSEDLGHVRMLTEREAHRLMGFTDDYKIVVSRCQAYKQAGNSIVVDVLMAIIKNIISSKPFD
ncbi:MAG: DNA cytosine methyltransferase [Clostridia bacterium]|nr:DNA cytosine methyltransferase [Clostridia bacterium]